MDAPADRPGGRPAADRPPQLRPVLRRQRRLRERDVVPEPRRPLYVYRLTHSPFLLGVLNFGNFVPVLLLAPWAGSAADRLDRRRLLLVTQLGSTALGALLAALAWTRRAPVWVVIVVRARARGRQRVLGARVAGADRRSRAALASSSRPSRSTR